MAKALLIETMAFKLGARQAGGKVKLIESTEGKLIAHGRFALADVPTANKRVYSRALFEREIARLKPAMKARRVFGEADHPDDGRTKLTRVACILLDLELTEEGEVLGTAEIIDTTNGKTLRAIIEAGGQIGVSSRGYGSVSRDSEGNDVVEDDFQLDTFDFVVDPAQGTAYPEFHTEGKAQPEGKMKVEGTSAPTASDAAAPTVVPAPAPGEEKEDDETSDVDGPADQPVEPKPEVEDDELPQSTTADMKPRDESVKTQIEQAVAKAKVEVRTEIESQLLSDPKVAGARAALESVKTILRPYILDKDVSAAIEDKDKEIAALKAQVESLTKASDKVKTENVALARAVKDIGFKFIAYKTLANHPKQESLIKSFGDLTLVEDVKALEALLAPHAEGLKKVKTEQVEGSRKLIESKEAEIARMGDALKKASEANKKLVAERDTAMLTARDVSLSLYVERKIAANPRAPQIRKQFKEMKVKTKETVDAMLEAFKAVPVSRSGDFASIRKRMASQGRSTSTLVEDSIKETGPQTENVETMTVAAGVSLDIAAINRLAGVK